ncbi:hypothetical protein BUALT_Bualt01G0089200 [Buddleja alternifolia]|uniref:Uncharacterized protein n=1 Tax=Buddleja alternifolia TaxID=168488 RepID=A0AAV6Y6K0_9LAMI|nr:hypothetical protein BUALT_Bualt01G0089200 [Buddleja alternifolia]
MTVAVKRRSKNFDGTGVSVVRGRCGPGEAKKGDRRGVHGSIYDKNPEEHSHSTVVPDHVIPPQPVQYWGPHPQTGVFGPATDHKAASGGDCALHASAGDSVLEQKTFFRPLEDLDKPVQP